MMEQLGSVVLGLLLLANLAGIYHTVLARRVLAGMSEVRNDLYWEDGVIKWTLARWYWFFVVTPVHVWAVWHYVHAHGSVVRQVSAGLLAAWWIGAVLVLIIYLLGWHDVSRPVFRCGWENDEPAKAKIRSGNVVEFVFVVHCACWLVGTIFVMVQRFIE